MNERVRQVFVDHIDGIIERDEERYIDWRCGRCKAPVTYEAESCDACGWGKRIVTVDDLIREAMSKFRAERGSKMIHAGGRGMRIRTKGERVLWLPNGQHVKVSTDDSGVATQVEEDEALHAIVRPGTINTKIRRP